MGDANATQGIQELGTEVLSTGGQVTDGLSSPIRGFRFTANFQGLGTTSFKSVSGFGSTVDVQEYREGGFGFLTKRKLPGLVNYDEITLEKGLYRNPLLYNFFNDYLEGQNFNPVSSFNNSVCGNAIPSETISFHISIDCFISDFSSCFIL